MADWSRHEAFRQKLYACDMPYFAKRPDVAVALPVAMPSGAQSVVEARLALQSTLICNGMEQVELSTTMGPAVSHNAGQRRLPHCVFVGKLGSINDLNP